MRQIKIVVFIIACICVLTTFTAAAATSNESDTAGPEIVSYTFSPTTVDVTSSPATVTVTAHVTDASGVLSAPIVYAQLSSNVTGTQVTSWFNRVAGTDTDGTYQAILTIPKNAFAGDWNVFSNSFFDINNTSSISTVYPTAEQQIGIKNMGHACPPSATTVTFQSRTASTITASWTAPSAEGLPVDNYKIEWSLNGTD